MTTIKRTNAGGRSPGKKEGDVARRKPTDMELMLYFDGELDETERADIESCIEGDAAAQRKLFGLRMASGIVRESALAQDLSIDVAASVMSTIEAGLDTQAVSVGAASKPVDILAARQAVTERAKPANDNSRGILTLAAIAVAAAAAMMIWGRMGAEPARSADNSSPVTTHEAPKEPVHTGSSDPAPAELPSPDGDMEHGVEVAAVDFGAHMGTIFYVPTGAAVSGATTTVVWVDDEVAGGK